MTTTIAIAMSFFISNSCLLEIVPSDLGARRIGRAPQRSLNARSGCRTAD
jgi:hypothetical protein